MQALVELTRALAQSQDIRDALDLVVRCVTEQLGAEHALIILARAGDNVGHVASLRGSSWPSTRADVARTAPPPQLGVNLEAHPEIRDVLSSGQSLLLDDAARARLALGRPPASARGREAAASIVPISYETAVHGVLLAEWRMAGEPDATTRLQLELCANAAGMALRNARVTESLLSEKQQITEHQTRVEHRMKFFQRYADFFESAAEGMIVVDGAGRILFSNPRASEISGYSAAELSGVRISSVLGRKQTARAASLIRRLRRGEYPSGVDVRFVPKDGRDSSAPRELTLNVAFRPVLRAEGAVLFTFRDVTAERATEVELRRTTEFLARVIDSSVDAIVSSDMTGRVLLFNRAAARIFGYEPRDVIGKLSVERLYPAGVAREVMRKIRSNDHGGPRRLEDYRVDMMDSNGELVPVKISAALIMDGDTAIGSVGVFTDVREKLRMEARLQAAQAELREREKSLALAELAGATAHELNQPLTGVIGYAELLLKQLPQGSPAASAAEVVLTEAQRMAEIVKKIGHITRYETRSYIGGTNIIDLDKAAPERSD